MKARKQLKVKFNPKRSSWVVRVMAAIEEKEAKAEMRDWMMRPTMSDYIRG